MADPKKAKAQMIADWEARQTPVGFYNLGLSYLEAADQLTNRIHATKVEDRPDLIFDHPVRHLYAQTWELALKACLFAQGVRPHTLKTDYGHKLIKVWRKVDKDRFAALKLEPDTEGIVDHLGIYHSERMFAYPLTGIREYVPLKYLMAESQRFRIDRPTVIELFMPKPQAGDGGQA